MHTIPAVTPAAPVRRTARLNHLDVLKAFAANLVVLHHLAFYGPMTDHAQELFPDLLDWLAQYGRLAVQVFLAIGGFLAARSLCASDARPRTPWSAATRRYLKLAPPYLAAILLAIIAAAIARQWMDHESIPAGPRAVQLLTHALLLQDIAGEESLSAGLWYIAIDFQLYVCLALLAWLAYRVAGRRAFGLPFALLAGAGCAFSLYYANRDAQWDVWGLYFFGSYGLGALAWWATSPQRSRSEAEFGLSLMVVLAVTALAVDFRIRILIAALTALLLFVMGRRGIVLLPNARWPGFFGRIAYALLLVHFPVCLVINACFTRFLSHDTFTQGAGVLFAWGASIAAAAAFQRWVEAPLAAVVARWQGSAAGRHKIPGGYRRAA
jgi:peptidoglycan/LPS O-acetylase OafA/YrhL